MSSKQPTPSIARDFDYALHHKNKIRSQIGGWVATGLGIGAGIALLYSPNIYARTVLATATLAGGVIAQTCSKSIREIDLVLQDNEDIITTQRNNAHFFNNLKAANAGLFLSGSGESEDEIPKDYTVMGFGDLTDSPHIAILGATGTGKSIFQQYLLEVVLAGQTQIKIDPHQDPSICERFEDAESALDVIRAAADGSLDQLCIGGGRDYVSIAFALSALYTLMDERYEAGGITQNWNTVNILVEEGVSIARNDATKAVWKEVQTVFTTEARKVGLRLILIVQGQQVKLLGLERASDLKQAYTFLRLGRFAVAHAIQQKKEGLAKVLQKDIEKSLDQHRKSKSKAKFGGTCWMVNDEGYIPYQNLAWLSQEGMNQRLPENLPDVYPTSSVVSASSDPNNLPVSTPQNDGKNEVNLPPLPSFTQEQELIWSQYAQYRNNGYSHSKAITEGLGKKGKYYKQTTELITQLAKHYNLENLLK